ncbi:MAG: DUF7502 family protein [Candidatus Methanogasteraceae archaeon]
MYTFTDAISELGGLSGRFKTYYVLLDLVLIFMASYAAIIFTGIHQICAAMLGFDIITFSDLGMEIAAPALCAILLAVAATLVGAGILMILAQRARGDACAEIGVAYPDLNEPLKTAYDNREVENVVMQDLAEDVEEQVDDIEYSSFLNQKLIASRVATIIVLAFFIISLAVADFSVVESVDGTRLPVIGMIGGEGAGAGAGFGESIDTIDIEDSMEGGYDIYGDPSVASIEGTDLDLTMYTGVGSEFSIREAAETEMQEFEESPAFPVEPVASEASEERIVDSDLVGRYFEELAAAG